MTRQGRVTQTDLFVSGQGGYHTYRIPAIVTTTRGTLLAFAEGRTGSSSDTDDIDIVLRRSTDNGRTWSPMRVIADMGADTIGNPCPIVDRETGTIWLLLCWNARSGPESEIVIGKAQRSVWLTRSDDDGATWSPLLDITRQVKRPDWRWYATGPCHGIQTTGGRLIAPCDFTVGDPDPHYSHYGSHVVYSDDHGASWQIGGIVQGQVNECALADLGDGWLYLNMRAYQGRHRRVVSWSSDGGTTWTPPRADDTLIEPVCQGSVCELGGGRVLFANPASTRRENMTVRLSEDGGRTWARSLALHPGPAAYSDLVVCPDGAIGCLYERGTQSPYETITFAHLDEESLEG